MPQIRQMIEMCTGNEPGWNITTCGHSLGGGLATLCAYDLATSKCASPVCPHASHTWHKWSVIQCCKCLAGPCMRIRGACQAAACMHVGSVALSKWLYLVLSVLGQYYWLTTQLSWWMDVFL